MTLSGALLEFWQAWYRLSPERRETPWGVVITDPRYPLIYDANHAGVFHPDTTAEEVLADLVPELDRVGAAFQHVEFWDPPDPCPALDEMAGVSDEQNWDVDMVFEEPRVERLAAAEVDIREVDPADRDVWAAYEPTQQMYGDTFSQDVVEQLNRRFREVILPAGLRMFAAYDGDRIAGFVNVLPLVGIAYLDGVVTLPEHRRRGVATAAVTSAVGRMRAEGHRLVHLLTEEGSAPQRLYERLGFRVHARVGTATRRRSTEPG